MHARHNNLQLGPNLGGHAHALAAHAMLNSCKYTPCFAEQLVTADDSECRCMVSSQMHAKALDLT
jgi:hypothetical protein